MANVRGVLAIYVPASDEAPHQAKDRKFYTRIGSKLRAVSTRSIFDIANRKMHPNVSATVRLNLFYSLVAISGGKSQTTATSCASTLACG